MFPTHTLGNARRLSSCGSGDIKFSGCSGIKALNKQYVEIHKYSEYFPTQRSYVSRCHTSSLLVISDIWEKGQYILLSMLQQKVGKVAVAGDGRCDSPAHSAKYGTYSLLDVNSGLILTTNLVQVRIISCCMNNI